MMVSDDDDSKLKIDESVPDNVPIHEVTFSRSQESTDPNVSTVPTTQQFETIEGVLIDSLGIAKENPTSLPSSSQKDISSINESSHEEYLSQEHELDSVTNSFDDSMVGGNASFVMSPLSAISVRERSMNNNELLRMLNSRNEDVSPALERRLRDFRFAQKKRRDKYGNERPWGIMGLYDYLTGVRTDVEWAEDAAWRRENEEPYLSWADFDDAKDTGFNRPFFTYIFMIICTIFLILSFGYNDWKIESLSVNPMIGPSAEALIYLGAKYTPDMYDKNQWWRLVSPMVLHAGLIHYFLNMLAFWFIGKGIEQNHGFFLAGFLFIVPAIGGTILSALFLRDYISVGASGGIFGLIGACMADIIGNWYLLFGKEINQTDKGSRFRHVRVLMWLLFDVLINIIIGLTPFIDNFTHLGGMIYGLLIGLSALSPLSRTFFGVSRSCWVKLRYVLMRFFGIILAFALIITTVAILLDNEEFKCKGCRFISCVPFPFWTSRDNKWWYCDDCERAEGAAIFNPNSTDVEMTCPNNVITRFELPYALSPETLRSQLPSLCRQKCEDVYYD